MCQRVGIARAFAVDPEILLMDEPFGALDAQTREKMGDELLKTWELEKKTVLFVTHSIDEAVFLADTVIIMGRGRIKENLKIELPRPRTVEIRDTSQFIEYRRHIRSFFRGRKEWKKNFDEMSRTVRVSLIKAKGSRSLISFLSVSLFLANVGAIAAVRLGRCLLYKPAQPGAYCCCSRNISKRRILWAPLRESH